MFHFPLTDHGLIDTPDTLIRGHGGDVQRNLQRDLSIWMDVGRNVYVDSYVDVLELRGVKTCQGDSADRR